MIHEFTKPIPVVTPLGPGYAVYTTSGGMLENDEWTVVLEETGEIRHFLTSQLKVWKNATYWIGQEKSSDNFVDPLDKVRESVVASRK